MNRDSVDEMMSRAETPLFWVGAFTVASLALWLLYRLLTGFRIWILGNGQLLTPRLGKWAGESGFSNYHLFLLSTCQLHGGHTKRPPKKKVEGTNFTLPSVKKKEAAS